VFFSTVEMPKLFLVGGSAGTKPMGADCRSVTVLHPRIKQMKIIPLIIGILLIHSPFALAQTGGGSAGASSAGTATGNSTGSTGSTLSNGSTISRTGGGPTSNTSNALNHGTTGNNLGATTTAPTAAQGAASTGNAVNTPAANQAQQKLSNPNTGIIKK
jgi:hypothetical protein